MRVEPGMLLSGRYRVLSVLGQGGMGSVYLARLEGLEKTVAVKQMALALHHEGAVAQFRQEAMFLANLDHPNLVRVSDFFEESGSYFLVMAYVEGQTLAELLAARGASFPLERVLEWGKQLCGVLTFLHTQAQPILFRDLKPSNIMLDSSGRIRLIDFGIARAVSEGRGTATFLQGVGSAGYAPLEQYHGAGGTDPRSDLYSLGATFYHLLTGVVPVSPVEQVAEGRALPPARSLNSRLPASVEGLLGKLMALRKGDRYGSAAEVARDLAVLERGLQQGGKTDVLLSARPPRAVPVVTESLPDRGFRWAAYGLTAGALGLFLFLYGQASGGPTEEPFVLHTFSPPEVVAPAVSSPRVAERRVVAERPVARLVPRPVRRVVVAPRPAEPVPAFVTPRMAEPDYPRVVAKKRVATPAPVFLGGPAEALAPSPEVDGLAAPVVVTPSPSPSVTASPIGGLEGSGPPGYDTMGPGAPASGFSPAPSWGASSSGYRMMPSGRGGGVGPGRRR